MRVLLAAVLTLGLVLAVPAAAQELIWHAPAAGTADQPISVLYTIGSDGYVGHVNVPMEVHLDGMLLFSTPSVHEHDGVHGFVLSAPGPGELALHARPAGMEERLHTVQVGPGAAAVADVEGASLQTDGETVTASWPGNDSLVLVEALDGEGRLRLATWQRPGDEIRLEREPAWRPTALFMATGDAGGAVLRTGAVVEPAMRLPDPTILLGALIDTTPSCGFLGAGIVLDPNSPTDANSPTWQEHSTIRFSWPNHGHDALTWEVVQDVGLTAAPVRLSGTTSDPHGQGAFTVDGPGQYELMVAWGDDEACRVPFQVVANPAAPGTVTMAVEGDGSQRTVRFTAIDAQGTPINHYEFDTRVLLLPDDEQPGRLVYAGKLHGHGGTVEFTMGLLGAGEYLVWTHPSPQNQDSAPVSAAGFDGFQTRFTVDAEPASYHDDGKDSPLPWWIVLGVLATALWLHRRK